MSFEKFVDTMIGVGDQQQEEKKEYLGNKGDQYFYFVHSVADNGEDDYVVVDADDKTVFSAREKGILDKEPREIVLAAIKSVDIDNICYELLVRYELLEPTEPKESESEPKQPELRKDRLKGVGPE